MNKRDLYHVIVSALYARAIHADSANVTGAFQAGYQQKPKAAIDDGTSFVGERHT